MAIKGTRYKQTFYPAKEFAKRYKTTEDTYHEMMKLYNWNGLTIKEIHAWLKEKKITIPYNTLYYWIKRHKS